MPTSSQPEERCSALQRALAACERSVAGRCEQAARACNVKRKQVAECWSALEAAKCAVKPPPSTPPPEPSAAHPIPTNAIESVDANNRIYRVGADGRIHIDDSCATRSLGRPPVLPTMAAAPACGKSHCVAVTTLGEAISWATSIEGDRFGQLGCGSRRSPSPYEVQRVALPTVAGRVTKVAAGECHSAFVSENGGVWLCGSDRWLQLGQDRFWSKGAIWQRLPRQVTKLQGVHVADVACGGDHTLVLDACGRVWAFGRGEHGQLYGSSDRPFTAPPAVSKALSRPARRAGGGGGGGGGSGGSGGQTGHGLEGCAEGCEGGEASGRVGLVARVVARAHCSCVLDDAGSLLRCVGECRGT